MCYSKPPTDLAHDVYGRLPPQPSLSMQSLFIRCQNYPNFSARANAGLKVYLPDLKAVALFVGSLLLEGNQPRFTIIGYFINRFLHENQFFGVKILLFCVSLTLTHFFHFRSFIQPNIKKCIYFAIFITLIISSSLVSTIFGFSCSIAFLKLSRAAFRSLLPKNDSPK